MKALSFCNFHRQVATLLSLDCERLGIYASEFSGEFSPDRLDELKRFCEANPEYHIVTVVENNLVLFNRIVPNAISYFLADGDNDRNLIGVFYFDPVRAFDHDTSVEEHAL